MRTASVSPFTAAMFAAALAASPATSDRIVRGLTFNHRAGRVVHLRGRAYQVAPDGSLRRRDRFKERAH
ncbi:MAG: hypothetical protein BroJett004_08290 [Planctomycetota bacterium]|nr:MAG: hypothetical protein BroJett004_08290 [Planctomycetota bacterium]